MAKKRQKESIVSAITAVTAALRIESIPNPTDEQKQFIHKAKVKAADCIDSSGIVTMAQFGDDDIAARIEAEEQAEAAAEAAAAIAAAAEAAAPAEAEPEDN